jgi:hypothetical protein
MAIETARETPGRTNRRRRSFGFSALSHARSGFALGTLRLHRCVLGAKDSARRSGRKLGRQSLRSLGGLLRRRLTGAERTAVNASLHLCLPSPNLCSRDERIA